MNLLLFIFSLSSLLWSEPELLSQMIIHEPDGYERFSPRGGLSFNNQHKVSLCMRNTEKALKNLMSDPDYINKMKSLTPAEANPVKNNINFISVNYHFAGKYSDYKGMKLDVGLFYKDVVIKFEQPMDENGRCDSFDHKAVVLAEIDKALNQSGTVQGQSVTPESSSQ